MTNLQLVGDLDGLLEQVRSAVTRFNGFAANTIALPTNEDSLYEDDTWLDASNSLISLGEALTGLGEELRDAAHASAEANAVDADAFIDGNTSSGQVGTFGWTVARGDVEAHPGTIRASADGGTDVE